MKEPIPNACCIEYFAAHAEQLAQEARMAGFQGALYRTLDSRAAMFLQALTAAAACADSPAEAEAIAVRWYTLALDRAAAVVPPDSEQAKP